MKFGTWLVAQAGRDEWIGALARAAAADAAFPRDASPDEVRLRLGEMAADPDAFEQLDDAEREWVASLARAA